MVENVLRRGNVEGFLTLSKDVPVDGRRALTIAAKSLPIFKKVLKGVGSTHGFVATEENSSKEVVEWFNDYRRCLLHIENGLHELERKQYTVAQVLEMIECLHQHSGEITTEVICYLLKKNVGSGIICQFFALHKEKFNFLNKRAKFWNPETIAHDYIDFKKILVLIENSWRTEILNALIDHGYFEFQDMDFCIDLTRCSEFLINKYNLDPYTGVPNDLIIGMSGLAIN
jgi:hypothetical protein